MVKSPWANIQYLYRFLDGFGLSPETKVFDSITGRYHARQNLTASELLSPSVIACRGTVKTSCWVNLIIALSCIIRASTPSSSRTRGNQTILDFVIIKIVYVMYNACPAYADSLQHRHFLIKKLNQTEVRHIKSLTTKVY